MYTECTNCFTVFAVTVQNLRSARGRVRCGHCGFTFNALENLEEGLPPDVASARGPTEREGHVRPAGAGEAPVPVLAEPEVAAPSEPADDAVPAVLREDITRLSEQRRAARKRVLLGAAGAALVVSLVLQYAWFEPEQLARSYPQIRPWVASWCEKTGCALPVRRAPELVQMVSRDVRVHPEYEGALRLVATIVNVAPYRQPFPRMRFTVFNVNGQTIASRTFEPGEYLQGSIPASSEMRPHGPTQIALDLVAPEEAAVSFEFRFL